MGKATVKCKCKGKSYKHKYVVQKYKNPVKILKFGSKNYASKFKKYVYHGTNKHVDGVKLVVKAAKGKRRCKGGGDSALVVYRGLSYCRVSPRSA